MTHEHCPRCGRKCPKDEKNSSRFELWVCESCSIKWSAHEHADLVSIYRRRAESPQ